MPKPKLFTATTKDMAILLAEELSQNQGLTPEGYLICQNVPVSRTGVQYYLGSELGLQDKWNARIPVYRLAEDVFEPESLQSLESKPITDDHPQQSVTVQNASYLSMGHGRNARHNDKNVVVDLVLTNPGLIQGIRDKRKYEISLGYNAKYLPYKDGYKQTNIRINHIAVVESGRAGQKVSIKDKALSNNRRSKPMNKDQAIATMFAAFAKDATPDELVAMLPFVSDSAIPAKPADADKTDKGLLALVTGLLTRDAKPAAAETKETPLTADAVAKLVADEVAKALKAQKTKDKKAKDADEEEVEKMLEDEWPDEKAKDAEAEEETEDADEEEAKESKDADFANVVRALQPLYKKLSVKDQKSMKDQLTKAKKNPTADAYAGILKAVQANKKVHDAEVETGQLHDTSALSRSVMASRNPHYAKAKKA